MPKKQTTPTEQRQRRKRKETSRRFLMYGIIGLIVAGVTAGIVLVTEGYYFDPNNREVIKNGLVFVDSSPQNALVTINGNAEKDRTESRFTLPEGHYNFNVSKDGYRQWSRSFSLGGQEVVNLNYVFLIPEKLQPSNLIEYPTDVRFASQSPDRRWLLIQRPEALTQFDRYDLNQTSPSPQRIELPAGLFPAGADVGRLEEVKWSSNGRHVLVKVPVSPTAWHWAMLDREDLSKSINLNTSLGFEFKEVKIRDNKPDKFYAIDMSDNLREIDTSTRTISAPRIEKVVDFSEYGSDRLLVATHNEETKMLDVVLLLNNDRRTLSSIQNQSAEQVLLDLTVYDGDWYIAVGSQTENYVQIFKNAFDLFGGNTSQPESLVKLDMRKPQNLSFSANTRFLSIQSDNSFVVYDNEYDRTYRYDLELPAGEKPYAKWMDGHRMILNRNNTNYIFDYDGINLHDLGVAQSVMPARFDRDYERYFALQAQPGKPAVFTQTSTLIPEDQ